MTAERRVGNLIGNATETGELVAPADGPVSWTSHADLAEGAAALLTADDRRDNDIVTLTAAEAVDLQQVADALSELTGRTIRRVVVDDDDYVGAPGRQRRARARRAAVPHHVPRRPPG